LSDYVSSANLTMRIGAIFGLGLAYAGSDRAEIIQVGGKIMRFNFKLVQFVPWRYGHCIRLRSEKTWGSNPARV
jgi:hypothetical protein